IKVLIRTNKYRIKLDVCLIYQIEAPFIEFFEVIVFLLILLNCNTIDPDQGSSRSRKPSGQQTKRRQHTFSTSLASICIVSNIFRASLVASPNQTRWCTSSRPKASPATPHSATSPCT
ncbi:hypothetical protein VIGAN_01196700, partial [Vigna angularis var. angularis]